MKIKITQEGTLPNIIADTELGWKVIRETDGLLLCNDDNGLRRKIYNRYIKGYYVFDEKIII